MPTPEEIKKIAREYAKSNIPSGVDEEYARSIIYNDEEMFGRFLEWLSKDYCIVPKSQLKEHYEDVCEDIRDYDGKGKFGLSCADMTMYQRARGMKQMLYRLFGTKLFNEEKE